MRTSTAILVFVLLIAIVAGGIFYFRDTAGPQIGLDPGSGPVSASRPLKLHLSDPGSGLRNLKVEVIQGETRQPLLQKDFPPQTFDFEIELGLKKLRLREGPLEIEIQAGDRSIYRFGAGSQSSRRFGFEFDNRPPTISLLSRNHNLNQGGSGMVVYTLSEAVSKTGVQLGENFFPAYQQPSGAWVVLFSYPYTSAKEALVPKVIAVDSAGNLRRAGIYYHVNRRRMNKTNINVSTRFLESKMPDFQHLYPETDDLLEIFLKVNRELRVANRARLPELAAETSSRPLWEGAFLRPKGATREPFATARTYFHKGEEIDRQIHLGVDIASVAQGPVDASNRGTVLHAGELGIYGQCVIIDHGLGLMSLYGHMSSVAVTAGDRVEKGQEIGRTGATGLAGGDHLHFGILVNGLPVNPVEWWDPGWVKNNLKGKLELAEKAR